MPHGLVHVAAVAKAHLNLGRVHVYIHPRRVHLDVQRIYRLAMAVQHVFIRAACGVSQHLVTHKTAVHVAELLVGARAGCIGDACAAPHAHRRAAKTFATSFAARLVIYGDGLRGKVCAQHIRQALLQRVRPCAGTPLLYQLALMPDGKAHIGAGQRVAAHGLHTMRQLGGVGFEEFAARGRAEEQLFHLHRGAGAARHGFELARASIQKIGIVLACSL